MYRHCNRHCNSSSLLKPEHSLMESLSSFPRGHTKVHLKGRTIVEHYALKMAYKNRLYKSINLTQFNPKKPELTKSHPISNIWLQSLKDLWPFLLRLDYSGFSWRKHTSGDGKHFLLGGQEYASHGRGDSSGVQRKSTVLPLEVAPRLLTLL